LRFLTGDEWAKEAAKRPNDDKTTTTPWPALPWFGSALVRFARLQIRRIFSPALNLYRRSTDHIKCSSSEEE
jgi:hypothetical protein